MSRSRSVASGLAILALTACGSPGKRAVPTATTTPTIVTTNTSLASCVVPPLLNPKARGSRFSLGGPAVTALRGAATRMSFSLDGGEFSVTPPRVGDTPSVSANQAECAALASRNTNGTPLSQLASSGVAVGYGRVTVASRLIADAQEPEYLQYSNNGMLKPTLPKATAYQQRLAWLVVVKYVPIFYGGAGGRDRTPASKASHASTTNDYVVFLLDARTGSDALLYAEGQPGLTSSTGAPGAAVTVPAEQVSVPWTLISRSPNGYAGTISATVLPCDGSAHPPILVDRYSASVAVIVERPVAASCGTPKHVTLALHAAVVTWNLPSHISHDPLGPSLAVSESTPPGNTYNVTCSHGSSVCVYNDAPIVRQGQFSSCRKSCRAT